MSCSFDSGAMLQERELKAVGIHQFGVISPTEIPLSTAIRDICRENACRLYGTTWACPPAVGTVEECRARCLQYATAMVFNAVYPLEDSFDYEGMMAGHRAFKELCDRLYDLASKQFPSMCLLSNEGCIRCKHCTYPTAACRMPERLFPALEGFGIQVAQLAKAAGLSYGGVGVVTYFGMLLY